MRCCICGTRIGSRRLSAQLLPEASSRKICKVCVIQRRHLISGNLEQRQNANKYFSDILSQNKIDPEVSNYISDLIRICVPESKLTAKGTDQKETRKVSFRLRHV